MKKKVAVTKPLSKAAKKSRTRPMDKAEHGGTDQRAGKPSRSLSRRKHSVGAEAAERIFTDDGDIFS